MTRDSALMNSKHVSLKSKMLLMVIIPIIALVSASSYIIYQMRDEVNKAEVSLKETNMVKLTSYVIAHVQVERGKSVAFLSGGIKSDELRSFRDKTDVQVSLFLEDFNKMKSSEEINNRVKASLNKITEVRKLVELNVEKEKIIGVYTRIVFEMIWAQVAMAPNVEAMEGILRVSMLETIRENWGLLRASVTGFILADKALTIQDQSNMIKYKAVIDNGLSSPIVSSSPSSRKRIDELQGAIEWKSAYNQYASVMEKANVGKFGLDSKQYFDTMSTAMNGIAKVIDADLQESIDISTTEIKHHTAIYQYTFILMLFLVIGTLTFAWRNVNQSSTQISKVATDVDELAKQVASSSQILSDSSQQVSQGSVQSASSLQQTVASIEEISSMVKRNAENANHAASLSVSSSKIAEEGNAEIQTLIAAMDQISTSSKRIEEIISIIDDIAFQTNLLALNAAVEAARAGEQGKGFSVVAEAVRALAQRSSSAAKDINGLIKESVLKIEDGSKVAYRSEVVLKNIVTEVKKVSDLNNEISMASREQSNGIDQIQQALNMLDASTQQNAAVSEEVANSSQQMNSQAGILKKLLMELNIIVFGSKGAEKRESFQDEESVI